MPDDAAQTAQADARSEKHAWMAKALGIDMAAYVSTPPLEAAPGGSASPPADIPIIPVQSVEIVPPPLPVAALAPKQAPPANDGKTPPTPAAPPPLKLYDPTTITSPDPKPAAPPAPPNAVQSRADLERRMDKSAAIYDQYGKAIGDDANAPADRLSAAEQRIGKVVSENDKEMVVTNRDGSRSTTQIALDGKDSRTTYDEKGITTTSKRTNATASIGADGKVYEQSNEHTESTNYGAGNVTQTTSNKSVDSGEGKTTTKSDSRTVAADLLKAEGSISTNTTTETKEGGTTRKDSETTTTTFGASGVNRTTETTVQTDKKFETNTSSTGLNRSGGQLGIGVTNTKKTGTMAGTEEAPVVEKGKDESRKSTIGLVSDDKGTGIGANTGQSTKKNYGEGNSLSGNYSAGGKYQSIVKEVPNSDPPKFTITTTISLDATVGKSGTSESAQPKPVDASKGTSAQVGGEDTHKGSATLGLTGSAGATASFKRVLTAEEAETYVESIKQNGRGSKLPEHKLLASGMKDGWDHAANLWAAMNGSADNMKDLQPGEEVENTVSVSAGAKAGVSGSERRTGGLAVGADASASKTHRVTVKKTKLDKEHLQVTATVDDSTDIAGNLSGSYGVASASHGATHGQGTGKSLVFVLNVNDPDFAKQLGEIDSAMSQADLDDIVKEGKIKLASQVEKDSSSDGVTDGIAIGGKASLTLTGKGAIANEVTRDADGNIIGSKTTATNETGGTLGLGEDVKASYSVVEGFTGEVGKDGAKAELSQITKQTDWGKTLDNFGNALHDPLGTVMNPGKLVGSKSDMKGIDLNDAELMGLATLALDEAKWRGQVGGVRQDDWLATGAKIRKAITVKDGAVTAMDKTAINRALGEWTKSTDGERITVLNNLVRPFKGQGGGPADQGAPVGKGVAFPSGTESYKAQWDGLMTNDGIAAAKGKLATDPKAALADLKSLMKQLDDLRFALKDNAQLWAGSEIQHAEMMGHVTGRLHDCEKAVHEAEKAAKPKKPGKQDTRPNVFAEEEEAEAQDELDLKAYTDNLEQMKTYFDAVFGLLNRAEKKLKDTGIFSGSGIDNAKEAYPWIKDAGDQLRIWDALYTPTYKLWEKLAPTHKLDKAAMERLHPHGAQERWKIVRELSLKV